jgi:hypothetical protein
VKRVQCKDNDTFGQMLCPNRVRSFVAGGASIEKEELWH